MRVRGPLLSLELFCGWRRVIKNPVFSRFSLNIRPHSKRLANPVSFASI